MEDDLEGLGVSSKDDQVGHASVEGLGGLVGALLQLYHMTTVSNVSSIVSSEDDD